MKPRTRAVMRPRLAVAAALLALWGTPNPPLRPYPPREKQGFPGASLALDATKLAADLDRLQARAERAARIVETAQALTDAETRLLLARTTRERQRARRGLLYADLALRDAVAPR